MKIFREPKPDDDWNDNWNPDKQITVQPDDPTEEIIATSESVLHPLRAASIEPIKPTREQEKETRG